MQSRIDDEQGASDYSGNELEQHQPKRLPNLETRGRMKKSG